MAHLAEHRGEYQEAQRILEDLLASNPYNEEAKTMLRQALIHEPTPTSTDTDVDYDSDTFLFGSTADIIGSGLVGAILAVGGLYYAIHTVLRYLHEGHNGMLVLYSSAPDPLSRPLYYPWHFLVFLPSAVALFGFWLCFKAYRTWQGR